MNARDERGGTASCMSVLAPAAAVLGTTAFAGPLLGLLAGICMVLLVRLGAQQ